MVWLQSIWQYLPDPDKSILKLLKQTQEPLTERLLFKNNFFYFN